VLSAQDQVAPIPDATANRIFARTTANIVSAFLQIMPGAVPPAPTGLAATAGSGQVQLGWNASAGATGYNVKRSTTNGGPYANVATGVTATSYTNTGLVNGTPYFYVVTAVNGSGESPISNQATATPQAGGAVTATAVNVQTSPWYNDQAIRLSNTGTLTALTVTVVIRRTAGITRNGMYNTVGGQILQSNTGNTNPATITYTWTLAAGQTLGPATNRQFSAQTSGSGTVHPTSGDTYTVTYTTGGQTQTLTGNFP
jgi:cellulose 1,4-beta-cellobiosidase